jgi:hypothetical protein
MYEQVMLATLGGHGHMRYRATMLSVGARPPKLALNQTCKG